MLSRIARLSRRTTSSIWGAIFAAGLLAGWLGMRDAGARLEERLVSETAGCAAALKGGLARELAGTRADLQSAAYAAVRERLDLFDAAIPNVRLASIIRYKPGTGTVVLLADSEPAGPSAVMLPGDDYRQARLSPGLQRVITTGLPSIQGPSSDASGSWVTGFALVPEGEGAASASAPKDILTLDLSADDWTGARVAEAFPAALSVWMALGLPFGFALVRRRQSEQGKAIRNLLGAMEQSHSAVMIVDVDGRIEYVNAALCAQMGHQRRELLGRPWRDFQQPDASPELMTDMAATVRGGSVWRGEWTHRRKNGESYPVRGAVSPVRSRDGSLACFVAVFEDMTEVRRNEAALRTALNRAEAGDRAKSQFLATISHEMRTPLNGIVGFTSLLLETPLTPEQSEYIQIVRGSGEALIQLTGDVLDLAQIESGSLKLESQPCDPRACVENTLDLLAVQAAEKNIELLHWVEDSVPASIMADTSRLAQVLVNFVGNAVKFTDAGEVEVGLRAERIAAPPGAAADAPAQWMLKFAVRDTGMGIAPEDHEKLFKPFNQLDVSNTRRHGGTGLGLAISKNLVELMGGGVSLESLPGRGSTFHFRIPVAEAPGSRRTVPVIRGLRVALAARPGPLRGEFARLVQSGQGQLIEVDSPMDLKAAGWDIGFVEVDLELARALAAQAPADPGAARWPADRTYALVSVSLPHDMRAALRRHFRQVISKPLHHDAVLALLAGLRAAAAAEERQATQFDLNVLVAEDNAVNQRLVQKLLWNLGCSSTVAENGRVAIEMLTQEASRFDLVLMDLHMPELDGLSAIERIRAGEAGPGVKGIWIAALTVDARVEQKKRVMAAGGNDYIVKPVKLTDLAGGLRRYLNSLPSEGA
jgi:PAS domain S-box-containing protein